MRTFDSSLKHQMLLMFRYYVADISASELEGTSVSVTATEVPALRDLRSARGGVSGAGALVLVVVVAVTGDVHPYHYLVGTLIRGQRGVHVVRRPTHVHLPLVKHSDT